LVGCTSDADLRDPALDEALRTISAAAIEEPMRFLADDALEGRAAGSRGYLMAADFVARELESLGLRPAGDGGTYFQQIPLLSTRLVAEHSSLALIRDGQRTVLEPHADYVIAGDPLRARAETTAPVAFAGFGVTAAEHGWNDYADLDVRGKIVIVLSGAPAGFPHDERAFYASGRLKRENAVARGAVGMLRVLPPAEREQRPWTRTVSLGKLPSMRWIDAEGAPHLAFPELFLDGSLSASGEARLFEHAPYGFADAVEALQAGEPRSFDLPVRLEVRTASRQTRLESPNVVAVLPGADPLLRDEYVLVTAHLDHLGVGDAVEGDAIYNGAYDNASGVAGLLAVARACSALPRAPRRSVIFLAVTGEEKGLLGSDYFAAHATVPVSEIVAAINLDMALMLHTLVDVIAFGAEHSTLAGAVDRAAARLDLDVSEDPLPEEVMFVRSDQFSFVRRGIPALFVISGLSGGDATVDGRESWRQWMRTTYHTPQDDMSQSIDFEAGAAFSRLNFLIVYQVANADERPEWLAGDFFGEKFADDPR
jgi:hypothetical protein